MIVEKFSGAMTSARTSTLPNPTEFGGQFLDWTGTPGQHWVQTLPLGLSGYKMARIAIGAVNHPRGAVRHSQLAIVLGRHWTIEPVVGLRH